MPWLDPTGYLYTENPYKVLVFIRIYPPLGGAGGLSLTYMNPHAHSSPTVLTDHSGF